MKKQKINLPIDGIPYPVEIKPVSHKDGTGSVFCWCKLDNGKQVKLTATLTPLDEPDCNGHTWLLKSHGWTTHVREKGKLAEACQMFVTNIETLNSFIEADKYVEVNVRIPKGEYCEDCPLFDDGAGYEYELRCRYAKIRNITYTGELRAKKPKWCPARQKS